jgi:hypothetical protein
MTVAVTVDPRIDDLRSIKPRTGGLKRKREAADVVQVFTLLDVRKVNLPILWLPMSYACRPFDQRMWMCANWS